MFTTGCMSPCPTLGRRRHRGFSIFEPRHHCFPNMLCARQGQPIFQRAYRMCQIQAFLTPLDHIPWKQWRSQSRKCDMHKSFSFTASELPPFDSAPTFRLTESPNPEWKYGEGCEASAGADEWGKGEQEGWKSIDTSSMTPRYVAMC